MESLYLKTIKAYFICISKNNINSLTLQTSPPVNVYKEQQQ